MIELKTELETVTFDASSDKTPEISGYGDMVPVEIYDYSEGGSTEGATVIRIGGHMFLESQLEHILMLTKAYKQSVTAYCEVLNS